MASIERDPEEYATELIRYFEIPRVGDVNSFAKKIGLTVREVPSQTFDGALIRVPNKLKGVVAVRETIRESGKKAFTVAHEIGHFVLPGHGSADCSCTGKDINSWQAHVSHQKEVSANRFASELLLPARTLSGVVNHRKATLALVREIANEYSTSLTATALKCVEVTDEACALVWSANNNIEWVHKNDAFWPFVPEARLDRNSCAGRLFLDHSQPAIESDVGADVWLSLEDGRDKPTLWEDSLFLPYYNAVLSILTINF